MSRITELIDQIKDVAKQARVKHSIEVKPNCNSGKSEEAFGFANVAAGDLLHSTDGTGLWNDLATIYDEGELSAILLEMKKWL